MMVDPLPTFTSCRQMRPVFIKVYRHPSKSRVGRVEDLRADGR